VLESQVGTKHRGCVQQDAAFVLWDKISFDEDSSDPSTLDATAMPSSSSPSPEWLRHTICCAQWETENADAAHPRVVLATLAQQQQQQSRRVDIAVIEGTEDGEGIELHDGMDNTVSERGRRSHRWQQRVE
jgi:hypothetical protein